MTAASSNLQFWHFNKKSVEFAEYGPINTVCVERETTHVYVFWLCMVMMNLCFPLGSGRTLARASSKMWIGRAWTNACVCVCVGGGQPCVCDVWEGVAPQGVCVVTIISSPPCSHSMQTWSPSRQHT